MTLSFPRSGYICAFACLLLFRFFFACSDEHNSGTDGDSDVSGENESSETDDDAENGIETPAETWLDEETGLLWANPEADDNDIEVYPDFDTHANHCKTYTLAGFDDWRLPTISELRSLITDCPTTEPGGACTITDECLDYFECRDDACSGCEEIGAGHCYLRSGLNGPCYWYATSNSYMHMDTYECNYYVNFYLGSVSIFRNPGGCFEFECQDHLPPTAIRCVREWE